MIGDVKVEFEKMPKAVKVIETFKPEKEYNFREEVWLYPGMAGWHFVNVPKKKAKEIKEKFGKSARGWGSLPIVATIGKTNWKTSIFPDRKSDTYFVPIKSEVRKKEGVHNGDKINFMIKINI